MNYAEIITESQDELKQIEKRQKLVQFQKRIHFLLLLKSQPGITQEAAGKAVGWQLRQSQKIWQLYRKGGVEAVLYKPKRWGFGKLSSQQIAQLQNYLEEFGGYSLHEIGHYLEQSFDVSYSTSGVSALCCRLKIKLKTARPSNNRKEEGKVETYKKTLAS
jgi:transposase